MNRFAVSVASFVAAFLLIGGVSSASFAAEGPAYRLIPAAAITAANTVVVNDTLWKVSGGALVAKSATSRPAIVCAQAARKIGKIESFSANGQDFTAEELAKCNAKAK
jgi:hypothetical protein